MKRVKVKKYNEMSMSKKVQRNETSKMEQWTWPKVKWYNEILYSGSSTYESRMEQWNPKLVKRYNERSKSRKEQWKEKSKKEYWNEMSKKVQWTIPHAG